MTSEDAKTPAKDDQGFVRGGKEKGAWPQHELLANYLREGILDGDYLPGEKLPSTPVLKEKWGLAPQTIKNANDLLAVEGLVESRRGWGIAVLPHRQHELTPALYKEPAEPGEPYRWLDEARKSGRKGSSTILEVAEVPLRRRIAGAMGLEKEDLALMRKQVLSLDGEPAELVESYYPIELARGTALMERKRIKGGTPRLLADMGFRPTKCVDRVAARLPTPEQVQLLELPGKLPVLRTLRVVYSGDRVIEVTVMVKASHLYEVVYEF